MIKLIIKNPDGSQTTKEITQDTTLSPSAGQQFYFDNADGSRKYTFNLADGEESVELVFAGNGERLVLNLKGMAELIKQSDDAINEKTKTVFMSFSNPYFSVAASICLLCVIGLGLFLAQNNTDSKLAENSIEEKTDLAYSITSKDLETAERLTASISQKIDLPSPKNGTAVTTTILEENASPENASLEQVAQVLKMEMNKE